MTNIIDKTEFSITDSKKGLLIVNLELIKKQRNVLSQILKKIGMNFIQGKSLMSVSFPVQIFDIKSALERFYKKLKFLNILTRMACSFTYAPYYLEKAGINDNIIEQLKLVKIKNKWLINIRACLAC